MDLLLLWHLRKRAGRCFWTGLFGGLIHARSHDHASLDGMRLTARVMHRSLPIAAGARLKNT
jgi:hypothetical protein